MAIPDFLLVGAAKAGTTSLARYLAQHPGVFMSPVKEPQYFALSGRPPAFTGPGDEIALRSSVWRREDYLALYGGARPGQVTGEASTWYLPTPSAAEAIRRENPGAKIIVLLRDPVERAWSSFLHLRRDGREPEADFRAALRAEADGTRDGWEPLWHYRRLGMYGSQLSVYLRVFGADRVRVVLHEDFGRDPAGVTAGLFAFLGVDPGFHPSVDRIHNPSLLPVNRPLHDFVSRPGSMRRLLGKLVPARWRGKVALYVQGMNLRRPSLPPETESLLRPSFSEEIEILERETGLDLEVWKRGSRERE